MNHLAAVMLYLLIGGVFAGGANESAKMDGEKLDDGALMFTSVAWPAVIGMVIGSALYPEEGGHE